MSKYEEGENILTKVRRILDENEPLTDGAPLIYTPKEDGENEKIANHQCIVQG